MKLVKACTNCGLYNHQMRTRCIECGSDLEEIIEEIPDEVIRKTIVKNVEDSSEVLDNTEKEQVVEFIRICKNGHVNDKDSIVCSLCGAFIGNTPPSEKTNETRETNVNPTQSQGKLLGVMLSNGVIKVTINYAKNSLIFGRDNLPQGDVLFRTISRNHFTYFFDANNFYVKDQSTNGMMMNNEKLIPGQVYPVCEQATLRLANHEFKISYLFEV